MIDLSDPLGLRCARGGGAEEMERNSKLFRECFESDAGRKVLAALHNRTTAQPVWVPDLDARHGYARVGQNSVTRYIEGLSGVSAAEVGAASVRAQPLESSFVSHDPLEVQPARDQTAVQAAVEEATVEAAQFKECFESDAGREVFAILRAGTIDQPTWVAELGLRHAYAREGQNSVVRYIETQLNKRRTA